LHAGSVVLANGTAKGWGYNGYGQSGDGGTTPALTPIAVGQPTLTQIALIRAGVYHTCALLPNGSAKCWGLPRLRPRSSRFRCRPSRGRREPATSLAVGTAQACAVLGTGAAKCWGKNTNGQLGNGATTNSSTPVAVTGLTNVVAIATGGSHSLAAIAGGTAKGWGLNTDGQVGDGTATQRTTPVPIAL
jgi:alpha-tubulin suppressor-like RCC1 family protein